MGIEKNNIAAYTENIGTKIPEVSVIVPAYNVEKYLTKCLNSLVRQTLTEIEIIIVNDGSTDRTGKIISEYADKDKRIIFLTQENSGPSVARNKALKIAKGEYVTFVDSDDWIDEDFVEKLYRSAVTNNADIAVGTMIRKRKISQKYRVHYTEEKVCSSLQDKINVCHIPTCCYSCSRLFRKKLVENREFKEGVYFEDVLWLPEVIKASNILVTVPDTNYYYRVNRNSITKKYCIKRQEDAYRAKKYIVEFCDENGIELKKNAKNILKSITYFLGIPVIRTKEQDNIETKYLFGVIPVKRKDLNYGIKIEKNTFLVWEPCSMSHSEVVPGYAKYLLDLGYEVSVVVNPKHIKDGLFSRFKNDKLFLNKISRKNAKKFFKENSLDNIQGILVTTAGKICDNIHFEQSFEHFAPDFKKSKLFLVEHDARFAIDENLWNEDLITLRKLNYKGYSSTIVNPHYFGDIKITPKNDVTNFVMVGSLSSKKITQNVILNAFSELVNKGYSNFKLTVIGKGSLKHIPSEIRKFIDIKGRLPFDKMYDELEKSDFILTSYNPNNPMHVFYNTTGTSGSFQLVYGFLKPCVILEEFAGVNDFNNGNAILYEKDADYSKALIRGIEMSKEDYQTMQDNLKKYADDLYKLSLENFKNLIERKKNG